ncbi:hypothetical protein L917_00556 [Phytophthora nicotianae]|uniref:Uncharacterized protein n=1 Tax=Phytophthora nicotianae TaxID=4792 RepID=W2M0D1_PHYNI|nr:hypothetical protein L917_00556 [Phytophthora nicotianae]
MAAGTTDGWNIRLFCQPPNSPDLYELDLGFSRRSRPSSLIPPLYCVDALIAVMSAFDVLTHTTLNDVFLTLQSVMLCILQTKGGNEYILPHIGKQKLQREAKLPEVQVCPKSLFATALEADPFIEIDISDK